MAPYAIFNDTTPMAEGRDARTYALLSSVRAGRDATTLISRRILAFGMARDLRRTQYGIEYIGKVVESFPLTPSCHGIKVEKPDEFDFKPVQFTFLSLKTEESEGWADYRSMSLATSPTRPHLEYGVRLSESAWKRAFQALEPGDEVMVEGAVGHFLLDEARAAVFVAGGIGITPLKGMIEYATDKDLGIPLRLIYSNRDQAEIAYRDYLDGVGEQNPDLSITHTLTREPDGSDWQGRRGRVDADLLADVSDALDDPVYYLCGAPGMVDDVRRMLSDLGVADDRVRYEEFWGYE